MNNLENLKQCLNNKEGREVISSFLDVTINNVDDITPDKIADNINNDCNICLCYGCRQFTHNCLGNITKNECKNFIIAYFSREFNPDTDNCQCPACRQRRGEDNEMHTWSLSYQDRNCLIVEKNLPEAKSHAVTQGIYHKEDYPYIKGVLLE